MVAKSDFDADDARLSAYALGELDADESRAVEALLQRDAEAREFVAGLRETVAQVERAFAEPNAERLDEPARKAIVERARGERVATASTGKRLRVVRTLLAAAIVVAFAGGTLLVTQPWDKMSSITPWQSRFYRDGARASKVERRGPSQALNAPGSNELPKLRELGYTMAGEAAGGPVWRYADVETGANQPATSLTEPSIEAAGARDFILGVGGGRREIEQFGTSNEEYDAIAEHVFRRTLDEALSTFSIDVDTASYANVRRHLMSGSLPSSGAVRVEELVNYFDYDYAQPSGAAPFSVTTDVFACPWDARRQLVRVGLKGREVHAQERKDSHLVFLIDVSGSMSSADKLPLVQRSLRLLTEQLDVRDRVSIVVYAGSEGLVLEPTSGRERGAILEAIERLESGGSTNGGAGIALAYKTAREHFIEGGVNRVLLCTDGDFNVGTTSRDELVKLIEEERKSGVFLSVLGFGTGNLKDSSMEQLADKGNGAYAYIDSIAEARKVLVEQMSGTLETIAKDVKIQIEFNPARVQAWRQIGYENRALAHQDFSDDTKDAGEIGAGHTVTALYEIVPVGVPFELPQVGELRYQTPRDEASAARGDEWLHVKLRYKAPDGDVSQLLEQSVSGAAASWSEAPLDARFAAAVAGFAMKLRDSEHTRELSYAQIEQLAVEALGRDERGWRREFIDLVRRADALKR